MVTIFDSMYNIYLVVPVFYMSQYDDDDERRITILGFSMVNSQQKPAITRSNPSPSPGNAEGKDTWMEVPKSMK